MFPKTDYFLLIFRDINTMLNETSFEHNSLRVRFDKSIVARQIELQVGLMSLTMINNSKACNFNCADICDEIITS